MSELQLSGFLGYRGKAPLVFYLDVLLDVDFGHAQVLCLDSTVRIVS